MVAASKTGADPAAVAAAAALIEDAPAHVEPVPWRQCQLMHPRTEGMGFMPSLLACLGTTHMCIHCRWLGLCSMYPHQQLEHEHKCRWQLHRDHQTSWRVHCWLACELRTEDAEHHAQNSTGACHLRHMHCHAPNAQHTVRQPMQLTVGVSPETPCVPKTQGTMCHRPAAIDVMGNPMQTWPEPAAQHVCIGVVVALVCLAGLR